jgi:cytochrome c-type biogenesis protein
MQEWIQQVLKSAEFGILLVPASLLLGVITAVGPVCNVAMLGAVAGYAGSRENVKRRDLWVTCACFMLATILALAALGWLLGHLGQAVGAQVGRYGKILAGLVAIFFGMAALRLVPFRLPSVKLLKGKLPHGIVAAAVFGLTIGAASVACTLVCGGPLLPIALGLAALQGQTGRGALIMAMFAVGYSLPMAAIMLGIGLGRMSGFAKKASEPVRIVAGVLLVVAGFWLMLG